MHRRDDLRVYQEDIGSEVVEGFDKRPGTLLALEMSLGKTVITLTAIRALLDQFVIRRVLIVAPLYVARMTWPDEIDAWEHTNVMRYRVLCGDAKTRLRALGEFLEDDGIEIAIINRENLPWLYEAVGKKDGWPFDALVYDESSRLKEGKKVTASRKLSEFGVLAKVRHKMSYAVELTGTPAPNGVIDLWGQIYILDMGARLGTTKTAFLTRWFEKDYTGFNYAPRPFAAKEIVDRIKDITISLRTEDVIELPEVVTNNIEVQLSPKQMKDYRRFERTLALEEYDVEAVNRGVLTNKLIQFANGGLYHVDEMTEERTVIDIHRAKLDALDSIIAETGGQNLLIAYGYKFDLDRLKKKFPKAGVVEDDPEALIKWNRGEIPQLLAHPASIGHGLNLQHGGFHTVWYGLTASLELYQQFNARLRRPGQANSHVYLHHIIARGTFDEKLIRILQNKRANQDDVKSALRMHLRESS